ncbi:MAG: carboxylesterase family protein [Gammaproteobacteria bacterium]|nr:carboxylesterase family protein [Gammaproteobacteria bacterium]
MKKLAIFCTLLLGLAPVVSPGAATATTRSVATTSGDLTGVVTNGIATFRGIPYAAPPVGAWRWRPPQPVARRAGTFAAEAFGPACPQSGRSVARLGGLPLSEDCLVLNVYLPAAALGGGEPVPVMVWIHGGSFRTGAGSYPGAEPLALVRHGVAVVTINYRLDRLGLFAHPALTAAAPADEPQGNYGLMDQVAALRWVHDNIAAFGGDPARVTVFGQSAGGVSVTTLMAVPSARGLFQRAIAQSGAVRIEGDRPIRGSDSFYESLEDDGRRMTQALGLDGGADVAARLRALPVETILAYSAKEIPNSMNPVVDGRVLPDHVARIFRAGRQHPVPFLSGTTNWEASLIAPFPFTLQNVLRDADPAEARSAYPGLDDAALKQAWFIDVLFAGPARFLLGEMARVDAPAWLYRFSYVPQARRSTVPGAAHTDDVPYVFDDLDFGHRWEGPPPTDAERELARPMSAYWVNFARTGDPNGPGLPAWPRYDRQSDRLLEFGTTISAGAPERLEQLRFHGRRYEAALE